MKINKCRICGGELDSGLIGSKDCGGDCLRCMADIIGDQDCVAELYGENDDENQQINGNRQVQP